PPHCALFPYSTLFRSRPSIASIQLAVAGFVVGNELGERFAQPLGGERAQDDAMLKVDLEDVGLRGRLVPVLVETEVERDFLARARGVAHVAVAAFEAVGAKAQRLPGSRLRRGLGHPDGAAGPAGAGGSRRLVVRLAAHCANSFWRRLRRDLAHAPGSGRSAGRATISTPSSSAPWTGSDKPANRPASRPSSTLGTPSRSMRESGAEPGAVGSPRSRSEERRVGNEGQCR